MRQNNYDNLSTKSKSTKSLPKGIITLLSVSQDSLEFGLRSLSSTLKRSGYEVNKIFLRQRMQEDISLQIVEQINNIAKDSLFLGISIISENVKFAKNIARKLKSLNDEILIVGGGVHPTIKPLDLIDTFDIVLRGEAEETIIELADKLALNEKIENIRFPSVYSNFYKSEEYGFIKNIDSLPYPDFTYNYLLSGNKICLVKEYNDFFKDTYFLLSSRGCPYACTYCGNNFFQENIDGKFFRKRCIDKVIDELKYAKENYNIEKAVFLSDNFVAINNDEFDTFISRYEKEVNVPFTCLATPNYIKEDRIDKLVKVGLCSISVGVQSGSERMLKFYKRNFFTPKNIVEAAKILNKYHTKLTVGYDLILDNPYESKEDVMKTLSLLRKIPRPYNLILYSLTYYPGTSVYDNALKDGLVQEGYYLRESKYIHKLKKSFYNSIFLLYTLNFNQKLIDYFIKCESSKNPIDRICKLTLGKATNMLLGFSLLKVIWLAIRGKNTKLMFHYIKLGFTLVKKRIA